MGDHLFLNFHYKIDKYSLTIFRKGVAIWKRMRMGEKGRGKGKEKE